jgi:hypothetical protein
MLGNKKRPWTKDEDQRLLTLAAENRSRISMGIRLKRSSSAIKGRLSLLRAAEHSSARSQTAQAPPRGRQTKKLRRPGIPSPPKRSEMGIGGEL